MKITKLKLTGSAKQLSYVSALIDEYTTLLCLDKDEYIKSLNENNITIGVLIHRLKKDVYKLKKEEQEAEDYIARLAYECMPELW